MSEFRGDEIGPVRVAGVLAGAGGLVGARCAGCGKVVVRPREAGVVNWCLCEDDERSVGVFERGDARGGTCGGARGAAMVCVGPRGAFEVVQG